VPCRKLLPLVRVWKRDYQDQLTIAVLSKGTRAENEDLVAKYGVTQLLLQGEADVAGQFKAKWTPAAVMISQAGRIAGHTTYGDEAIGSLVNHTVSPDEGLSAGSSNGAIPPITVGSSLFKVGEAAPRFSLTDLGGRVVSTEDLLGRDTLLVFWDSGCPYCQALSEDIRRWEENPPRRAPELAIIASGEPDDVRTKVRDLESLVLLDPDFEVGALFGSNSTPSAVLIDADGRIASSLVLGDRDVLLVAGVSKVKLPIASTLDSSSSTASIM
jgi:thiol-disulfide isomerase/thioredoxin